MQVNNDHLVRHASKYLLSGGAAFITDYGGFLLLHYALNVYAQIASVISFAMGFCIGFVLQRQWVFASQGKLVRDMVLYALLVVFNLLTNYYGILLLVRFGLDAYIAKLMLICVITIWNYVLYRKVIFI